MGGMACEVWDGGNMGGWLMKCGREGVWEGWLVRCGREELGYTGRRGFAISYGRSWMHLSFF